MVNMLLVCVVVAAAVFFLVLFCFSFHFELVHFGFKVLHDHISNGFAVEVTGLAIVILLVVIVAMVVVYAVIYLSTLVFLTRFDSFVGFLVFLRALGLFFFFHMNMLLLSMAVFVAVPMRVSSKYNAIYGQDYQIAHKEQQERQGKVLLITLRIDVTISYS